MPEEEVALRLGYGQGEWREEARRVRWKVRKSGRECGSAKR